MKKFIITGVLVIVLLLVVVAYLNNNYIKQEVPRPSLPGARGNLEKISIISNGEKVNIADYLVKDYVLIFDFYADWCGPCQILAPKMEQLAAQYNDVLIRKVNIDRWGSPVAQQYQINFVPNVRVYDRKGNMVGEPTPGYDAILKYVNKARSS